MKFKLGKAKLLVLFMPLFGSLSPAQTPIPTPTPIPKFTVERNPKASGLPAIRLIFTDGREASSFIQGPIKLTLTSQVSSTENLCHPEMAPGKCNFQASIYHAKVSIQWTKHPDVSKIGQILDYNGGKLTEDLQHFGNVTFQPDEAARELYTGYRADTVGLTCSNYGWLTGDTKNDPEQFRIESLLAESMVRNPETDNDENRVTDVFNNLVFKKDPANGIYQSAQRANLKDEFNVPLAQTYSLVMGSNSCQITMSHNLGALLAAYTKRVAEFEKTEAMKIYSADKNPRYLGSTIDYNAKAGGDYK